MCPGGLRVDQLELVSSRRICFELFESSGALLGDHALLSSHFGNRFLRDCLEGGGDHTRDQPRPNVWDKTPYRVKDTEHCQQRGTSVFKHELSVLIILVAPPRFQMQYIDIL